MEILKTKDYARFKFILSNREIDEAHVRRLAKSIMRRNLLNIRPILVNGDMMLIDGQHRLEAAKSIGAEVYYLMVDDLTKSDIAVLNTAQKNWTRGDFINFYALEGNPAYKQLSALINKYHWLTTSAIIHIACERGTDIRGGSAKLRDAKRTIEVCDQLRSLQADYPFIADYAAACAFSDVVKLKKEFDYIKRTATAKSLYKCVGYAEYKQMFLKLLK